MFTGTNKYIYCAFEQNLERLFPAPLYVGAKWLHPNSKPSLSETELSIFQSAGLLYWLGFIYVRMA